MSDWVIGSWCLHDEVVVNLALGWVDHTSLMEKLSGKRPMSPPSTPSGQRGDEKNRTKTGLKSFSVNPSNPIYILSREKKEEGKNIQSVIKQVPVLGGRLDVVWKSRFRTAEICVNPLSPGADVGGHVSGEVIL